MARAKLIEEKNKVHRGTSWCLGGICQLEFFDFLLSHKSVKPCHVYFLCTPVAIWSGASWKSLPFLNGKTFRVEVFFLQCCLFNSLPVRNAFLNKLQLNLRTFLLVLLQFNWQFVGQCCFIFIGENKDWEVVQKSFFSRFQMHNYFLIINRKSICFVVTQMALEI